MLQKRGLRGLGRPPLGVALALLAAPAVANDGGIAFGGSPRLLTGHPTVSMESEVVRIDVGEQNVRVDCRFVFRNDGPAGCPLGDGADGVPGPGAGRR